MSAAVLRASLHAVPRRAVTLHAAAAVGLLAVTWNALDHHTASVMVLRGVALLLAASLALAVDEPSAVLLDAAPVPMAERLAARLTLCAAVVLPVWVLALAVTSLRGGDVPLAAMTLELAGLVALALVVPLALRRWWRVSEPAVVAGPLLLGALLAAAHLPASLALLPMSRLDASWDAAHQHWSVLLVAALALLARELADPSTARTAPRLR